MIIRVVNCVVNRNEIIFNQKHKLFLRLFRFSKEMAAWCQEYLRSAGPGRRPGGSSPEAGRGTNPKNETGGWSLTRDRPRKRGSDVDELSRKFTMATKKPLIVAGKRHFTRGVDRDVSEPGSCQMPPVAGRSFDTTPACSPLQGLVTSNAFLREDE